MAPVAIQDQTAPAQPSAPLKNAAQPASATPGLSKQSLGNLSSRPLDRVWRGNEQGTVKLQVAVPDFGDDLYAKREWVKQHLAGAFQMWGSNGFGEGVAGHITVRDPVKPDHYWMNPFAVHFSAVTVDNLVLVTPEGWVSPEGAQLPINTAGFHLHSAIHDTRPEIQAAAHCHTVHGKAWSVFGKPVEMLTQDACMFYDNLSVYNSFGGIVLAADEGANIAKALGPKNKCAILQNHGLMTLGDTVDEAAYLFAALERQCKVQLMMEAALAGNPSLKKNVIDDEDAAFTAATLTHWEIAYTNAQPEFNLLVQERGHLFLGKNAKLVQGRS
ncbi:hypothetical protein OIV83_005389 [Microbotryomycetes sp. JL201]|nr:hypothetical protein OIV83_005389 [Microbotryomycetes sp. JL201]